MADFAPRQGFDMDDGIRELDRVNRILRAAARRAEASGYSRPVVIVPPEPCETADYFLYGKAGRA